MYTSKLVTLLKTLDSRQKEAFKKWTYSPVHLQHKMTQELLSILLSKRNLTPKSVDRHTVFKQLYPQQIYKDSQLKHLMSYATKQLEDFIEFLMQQKATFENKKKLVLFLEEKQLDTYTKKQLKQLQRYQEQRPLRNSRYFEEQYQLEKLLFFHQNNQSRQKYTNLQPLLDAQSITFVLDTLYYACEVLTHQRLYKSNYRIPLLAGILTEIEAGFYATVPTVQLYYYGYKMLEEVENTQHFEQLQVFLLEYATALSKKELKHFYLMAINYCVQRLNSGLETYVRKVFELFQQALKWDILIEEGQLSQFTYKNIMTAAIRLEEYAWTALFITNYTPLLPPKFQSNYACFANAKLHFAQGHYDACLQLLAQVEFDDLFLNMSAKSMLLKIYYERQDFLPLHSLLTSFRRFLQRQSIVAYQRQIYENFLVLTEKLLSLPPKQSKKKNLLRHEIEQTSPLTERPWLLTQLEAMS
ncbi:MAG: hypothetical protein ACRBFS_19745 [Aureispira sp.]